MLHLVTSNARHHSTLIDAGELHAFPSIDVATMQIAIDRVHEHAATPSCNDFFTKIGDGDSLQTILGREIHIYYNPSTEFAGYADGDVVIITRRALNYGGDALVAVLIHELAHIGGVRGEYMPLSRTSHGLADHAALRCVGTVTPHTVILNPLSAYPL
jgi:hypothetical protein